MTVVKENKKTISGDDEYEYTSDDDNYYDSSSDGLIDSSSSQFYSDSCNSVVDQQNSNVKFTGVPVAIPINSDMNCRVVSEPITSRNRHFNHHLPPPPPPPPLQFHFPHHHHPPHHHELNYHPAFCQQHPQPPHHHNAFFRVDSLPFVLNPPRSRPPPPPGPHHLPPRCDINYTPYYTTPPRPRPPPPRPHPPPPRPHHPPPRCVGEGYMWHPPHVPHHQQAYGHENNPFTVVTPVKTVEAYL